jgi:hypothetical protein
MPEFWLRKPGYLCSEPSFDPRRRGARSGRRLDTRRTTSSRACAFLGLSCARRVAMLSMLVHSPAVVFTLFAWLILRSPTRLQ